MLETDAWQGNGGVHRRRRAGSGGGRSGGVQKRDRLGSDPPCRHLCIPPLPCPVLPLGRPSPEAAPGGVGRWIARGSRRHDRHCRPCHRQPLAFRLQTQLAAASVADTCRCEVHRLSPRQKVATDYAGSTLQSTHKKFWLLRMKRGWRTKGGWGGLHT